MRARVRVSSLSAFFTSAQTESTRAIWSASPFQKMGTMITVGAFSLSAFAAAFAAICAARRSVLRSALDGCPCCRLSYLR